jgi:DNA-binding NtrC family response regulator
MPPFAPAAPEAAPPAEPAPAAEEVFTPPPAAPAPAASPEVIPLDQLEKRAILAALQSTAGNRTRAAELLNISIRTLRNKLQEYRLSGDFVEPALAGDDS